MHWVDILKFQPLVERLAAIDHELDQLADSAQVLDPDAYGLLDVMEQLVGEGFLLCQVYMIERKGERRASVAYACGPRHNANFLAQVLHTAGNYRKHYGEWPSGPTRWGHHELGTVAVLRDAGVIEASTGSRAFWLTSRSRTRPVLPPSCPA